MDESVISPHDIKQANHADYSQRTFIFVDYSQLDSGLVPEGKSVGALSAMDSLSDWEWFSDEDYYKKKKEVAQILIGRLEKLVPGIKDEIEYYEVATPKTIKRYTLNPEGAAYGYAQLPDQAGRNRVPLRSPVKNLYFASAWSQPGHGFTGTILGGYWCAEEILHNW